MRSAALLLAAASLAGCASLAPKRLADCPGPLRSTREIAGDFVRQERIRVRGRGVDEAFALVIEKSGARLVVLGLNAFGAKAFSLRQQDLSVESTSYLGRALAVPPENVLRDLHRAYFLTPEAALASERSATPGSDGAIRIASAACGYESTLVRVSSSSARPDLGGRRTAAGRFRPCQGDLQLHAARAHRPRECRARTNGQL